MTEIKFSPASIDTVSHSENDQVRLNQDIPELGLRCGDIGIVCSKWFAPSHAYEVEFEPAGLSYRTRVLLMSSQIAAEKIAG